MNDSQGAYAINAARAALADRIDTELHLFGGDTPDRAPYWRSGIGGVDQLTNGGFYGVTVISGSGKLGKTTLSLASALEAAASGCWNVVYFNAELDEADLSERVAVYAGAHPHVEDAFAADLFTVWHVGRGVDPRELVACMTASANETRMLVVLDSINTISNLANMDYLKALREFSLWAMMSRRLSEGLCAFQIVAETNAKGGIKGEQLQFWADLVLRMSGGKEQGTVDLKVTHSRRTPDGDVGRFLRHVVSGSFKTQSEVEHWMRSRVVQGGAA